MNEQIQASPILDYVRLVLRVTRNQHRASAIVDAVTVRGMNQLAVVHLERGYANPFFVKNTSVLGEFMGINARHRLWHMFVCHSNPNVVPEGHPHAFRDTGSSLRPP